MLTAMRTHNCVPLSQQSLDVGLSTAVGTFVPLLVEEQTFTNLLPCSCSGQQCCLCAWWSLCLEHSRCVAATRAMLKAFGFLSAERVPPCYAMCDNVVLQVLSWIDVCAGLSAKTLARGPCVTISVDAVHFFR